MYRFWMLLLAVTLYVPPTPAAEQPTPSKPMAPQGKVTPYTFAESNIFPGTVRTYHLYVPKQYDPAKPACVFVCQDGISGTRRPFSTNSSMKWRYPLL